jgi:hypothetical protein
VRLERISEKPRVNAALKKREEPGSSWVRCFIMKACALEKTNVRHNEIIKSAPKIENKLVVVVLKKDSIKIVRKDKV